MSRSLSSRSAACLWVPTWPLHCEALRRPELGETPHALLAPEDSRRLWQLSRDARRQGAKTGMTVSQAIGLCPTLALLEPDPVYYDEQFAHLLKRLANVSPVVEPAELGRVFVGMDGLERLYGGAEEQLGVILDGITGSRDHGMSDPVIPSSRHPLDVRLGYATGKFPAWVAATRARPGEAIVVPDGEEAEFLGSQPIAVLPLERDDLQRLRQLGLNTLGQLTALPEEAITTQLGKPGRAAWRLAAGQVLEPVIGKPAPEPILQGLTYPSPVADSGMLAHTIGVLVEHALRNPRRTGWRIVSVRVRAALEQGGSWQVEATLKDPSADRERIAAPLRAKLGLTPPVGAVERIVVEFTDFARGTDELQLFARDAAAAARAGRVNALRSAAREITARMKRTMLYRIVEVQPWSRLPERRYALIAYEP